MSGTCREPPALRRRDLSVPIGPAHADLSVDEIHVRPLQRHHLAAPQTRITAQEHDEMSPRVHASGPLQRAVRTRRSRGNAVDPFGTGRSLIEHGICSITSHSTAFFNSTLSTVSMLLTVFGALCLQTCA